MTDWKRERKFLNANVDALIAGQLDHYGERQFLKDDVIRHVFVQFKVPAKENPVIQLLLRAFITSRVNTCVNRAKMVDGHRAYGWFSADGERRYQRSKALARHHFDAWAEEYHQNRERVDAEDDFIQRVRDKAEQLALFDDDSIGPAWDAVVAEDAA